LVYPGDVHQEREVFGGGTGDHIGFYVSHAIDTASNEHAYGRVHSSYISYVFRRESNDIGIERDRRVEV